MNVVFLLESNLNLIDVEIDVVMNGNICCCGVYVRIKVVIKMVVVKMS